MPATHQGPVVSSQLVFLLCGDLGKTLLSEKGASRVEMMDGVVPAPHFSDLTSHPHPSFACLWSTFLSNHQSLVRS